MVELKQVRLINWYGFSQITVPVGFFTLIAGICIDDCSQNKATPKLCILHLKDNVGVYVGHLVRRSHIGAGRRIQQSPGVKRHRPAAFIFR